jgi:hypothetical protein
VSEQPINNRNYIDPEVARMSKDELFGILAQLQGHFAAEGISPEDANRWRELKDHVTRMVTSLDLIAITAHEDPPKTATMRKIEAYARFGLGEKNE